MSFDFPTNPASGTVVMVPDGSYRVWDSTKWRASPSSSTITTGPFLPIAGGVMSGALSLFGNATQPLHAVPLQQLNTATAGGPFLPLTGGSVARHMTGTANDSNISINATAIGSGVNGPATAQNGMTVNMSKDGWFTGTSAVGEIDGINIIVRQGGSASDCGGILVNVVGTGAGFLAINECVVQQQQINTGAALFGIRTQEGGMNPVTGGRIGKFLLAEYGNLSAAIHTENTSGQGYWGSIITNLRDNVQTFNLDDHGSIITSGSILINNAAAGVLTVQGSATATVPGATLMWSPDATGRSFLLNNKGGGSGGFVFGDVNNTGTVTSYLAIDASGAATLSAPATIPGLKFPDAVAAGGVTDLSKHINLGYGVGFNITPGRLNYFATTGNTHAFIINSIDRLTINATGLGFNSTPAIAKPTVTGAKGANAALASLLSALAAYGLVTDSTSA
jgi:hypothetical protein